MSRLSPEAIEAEAMGSKRTLEKETGLPADLFAYPNGQPGDFTEECKAILRKCGFACAVTTIPGVNTAATDRFALHRRHVWDATPDGFYLRFLVERWRA
jgi:peptidoglycan/xylan/chitin deacetylase (PgdA/CDA1 family)